MFGKYSSCKPRSESQNKDSNLCKKTLWCANSRVKTLSKATCLWLWKITRKSYVYLYAEHCCSHSHSHCLFVYAFRFLRMANAATIYQSYKATPNWLSCYDAICCSDILNMKHWHSSPHLNAKNKVKSEN